MKKVLLIAAMAFVSVAGFAQNKFAHVNFTELYQLMPEADEARATMAASSQEAQDTYQAMIEEYQTKAQEYDQKQASWTQSIRESKANALMDMQQRIQEFEQNVQQELSLQQNQLMAPLYEKAQKAVEDLAKAGGYIYVFEASSVLYVDPAQSTDLTPAARKALNIPEGRTLETLQAELQAQQAQ
ncbi:MAG: OmpH family outer membrane protein [Bacteroidia bacterium]|nr:OmpH family outer membrane protein [Bacteroidia bacterium]